RCDASLLQRSLGQVGASKCVSSLPQSQKGFAAGPGALESTPTMASTPILVGTAGWSYPDWENLVYPPGRTAGRLRLVARYLDCVEVDSSFYRPPTARAAESWVRAVESRPQFRFLAK